MTAASDLQWGRQGGRVGVQTTALEALEAIDRARTRTGVDWPTHPEPPSCCAPTSCQQHTPRCDTCSTDHGPFEQIGRGNHCPECAPAVWAGLARMADARRHAGHPLDHWDRQALGTLIIREVA